MPISIDSPTHSPIPSPIPSEPEPVPPKPPTPAPPVEPPKLPMPPKEDPSKTFFQNCCANRCIAACFMFFWKISIHLYLFLTCCFNKTAILKRIKVPAFLRHEDRIKCRDFLESRGKPPV